VIVCSCNVLSDAQILATLKLGATHRAAGTAYRCLGCAPRCGRCLETVRSLLEQAHVENCQVGCADCPAHQHPHTGEHEPVETPALMAAE